MAEDKAEVITKTVEEMVPESSPSVVKDIAERIIALKENAQAEFSSAFYLGAGSLAAFGSGALAVNTGEIPPRIIGVLTILGGAWAATRAAGSVRNYLQTQGESNALTTALAQNLMSVAQENPTAVTPASTHSAKT